MAKEWTDDEVQEEINKAIQIVREDRIDTLIRNRLSAPPPNPDDKTDKTPESGGNSDKDNGGKNPTGNKKRGLWWGDAAE